MSWKYRLLNVELTLQDRLGNDQFCKWDRILVFYPDALLLFPVNHMDKVTCHTEQDRLTNMAS